MKSKIRKTDSEYSQIVDMLDENRYDIDSTKLLENQEVECPNDADMSIIKNNDGTVTVKKRCFTSECFAKY